MRVALLLWLLMALPATLRAADESAPLTPQAFGNGRDVIRLSAAEILRWQDGDTTLLDLRGSVEVYQGAASVSSNRLLAWFRESPAGTETVGSLELYGEKGTLLTEEQKRTPVDGAAVLRLTAPAGLVLRGLRTPAGEPPIYDPFHARAFAARGETPPAATEAMRLGLFGDVRTSAEQFTFQTDPDKSIVVTLTGNAQVATDRLVLSADVVRVRIRPGEGARKPQAQTIYAEGAVDLRRANERVTADRVFLDLPNEQGLATDARVRTSLARTGVPIQFHADAIREESQYRFRTEGAGYITTSAMAEPHWRVEASNVDMIRGPSVDRPRRRFGALGATSRVAPATGAPAQPTESLVVAARHSVVYVESVPVLYWPYVAKDVRSGSFLLREAEVGSSGNLGTFLRLGWDLYDLGVYFNTWSELTLRTDYYSARGAGTGLDFNYTGAQRLGFFRSYYIRDTAEEDDTNIPVPQKDRGEFTWRHREFLSDNWRADGELGYLSDRRFLRTYDRKSFDEDKDRETQLFLSRLSENSLLTTQARFRLSDFQTQVERQAVAYHLIGERVADTPLLWTSHTEMARLQLRTDRELKLPDPDPVGRLDTAHELSWPLSLGPVQADPYVWADATGYSRQAGDAHSTGRLATAYGLRTATNFYRTYDAYSPFFGVDRLRHVVTPSVDYENLFWVSRDPATLTQHDEIDALDETHRILYQLRNRLQTYRVVDGRRDRVDFLIFDLRYAAHFRQPDALRNLDDYVQASLRWLVSQNLELASVDNRYNIERGRVESLDGEIILRYWRPLVVSFIQKYYLDLTEAGEPSHNVSLLTLAFQPKYSRWGLEFTTAYDFSPNQRAATKSAPAQLGTGLFVTRDMEGWLWRVGAEINQGIRNDTVFTFDLTPPGVRREYRINRTPTIY